MSVEDKLYVTKDMKISSALKKMDEIDRKLLIVVEDNKFHSLLSIGDIQRAIIKNFSLDTEISEILRKNVRVLRNTSSFKQIKKEMHLYRTECMPIIDGQSNIVDIYFWEEVFKQEQRVDKEDLNCPVVIMAGGKGLRLKPITNIIPKPLIPLGNKTIIESIIDHFLRVGCREFHLSINYKKRMIEQFFDAKNNADYSLSYITEEKPLGTAGSLYLLKNKIKTTFFVSNCDIIIEQDYHDLFEYHHENRNEITLVAALKHYQIPYGTIISGKDGILERITEKPDLTFKINSGLYILEPHLLNSIPENQFFHITELIDQVRTRGGRVGVFPVSENSWIDIGEWPEYIKSVRNVSGDGEQFKGL